MTIKKKRKEKGIRALSLGSNPHSKGLDFSREFKNFFRVVQKIQASIKKNIPPKMTTESKNIENILKARLILDH